MLDVAYWHINRLRAVSLVVAEEGIEMQAVGVPVGGQLDAEVTRRTWNGTVQLACAASWTESIKDKAVVGFRVALPKARVVGQMKGTGIIKPDGGKCHLGHRPVTQNDVGIVDKAFFSETTFVEAAEVGVGAFVCALGVMVQADAVGLSHIRRQADNLHKGVAVLLLGVGLGIAYFLRHVAYHLFLGDGVDAVNLVAESAPQ